VQLTSISQMSLPLRVLLLLMQLQLQSLLLLMLMQLQTVSPVHLSSSSRSQRCLQRPGLQYVSSWVKLHSC
jgi:hypothetical protein